MPSVLSSIFTCSHEFFWPRRRADGSHCQACLKCRDNFFYDWRFNEDGMKPTVNRHRTFQANGPEVRIEDMIRECVEICAQVADQHLATEIAHAIRRLKPVISWP